MSKQNVEPDVHTVKVNITNVPKKHSYGSPQHASGTVSPDRYSMESRAPKRSSRSDAVYVNSAYVGSVNSLNNITMPRYEPPTSVIREQYWTCSKWPFAQRVLAVAVGLLVGAVLSLVITLSLRKDDADLRSIFQVRLAPD